MSDFVSVNSYSTFKAQFSATVIQSAPILLSDTYEVEVDFLWADMDPARGNAAFMKMRYFLEDELHQSVLTYPQAPMAVNGIENNIVLFPFVPTNDIIAMTLHAKLNTICGQYIEIISVRVGSKYAQPNLIYTYADDEYPAMPSLKDFIGLDTDEYYYDQPWWFRSDATTGEFDTSDDKDLTDPPEPDTILDDIEKMVMGELKLRDGDQGGEVVDIKGWKPKIIDD
jgi:hypothetical protein